jgi:diguanylate cyclase (GGDEF)-like protein/PAS domain S-box-containing protein
MTVGAPETHRWWGSDSPVESGVSAETLLDDLAAMAARLCAAPMAIISLVDDGRQWLPTQVGIAVPQTPQGLSFCTQVMADARLMVIADARTDDRFATHPLVLGPPFVRFCAGTPLIDSTGGAVGTLCVLDVVARQLSTDQQRNLTVLAGQLASQLELRRHAGILAAEVDARAAAQEALRLKQRVLDGVLRHTDVLVYAKDLTGRYIVANRALERALNLERELVGGFDIDLFPPEQALAYRANDAVIMVKHDHQVFDEELIHADGIPHLYQATKFALLDDNDQVYAIAGVSTDVTELVAARAAHEEAEARWRALVEYSPVAVAVVGRDRRFRYANPAAMVLFGLAASENIEGRLVQDFTTADEHDGQAALYDSVAGSRSVVLGRRWHLVQPGGLRLTVEVNAASIDYLGAPALQIELSDVTVKAEAEEALQDSEHRFHALFNGSPVPMALSDADGLWVDANGAFGALLGVDPAEMIGHSAQRFAHPDDHVLVSGSEQGQKDSLDGVFRTEMRFLRPDGDMRWAWLTITPTPGPAGQIWTLAIAQDVTARKAAENALRESESDLAAIAAVARCVQDGEDPRPLVVNSVLNLAGASSVCLLEPDRAGALIVTAAAGGDFVGHRIPLDLPSMTAQVWRTGESVFLSEPRLNPIVNKALLDLGDTVSAMWQPVIAHGQVQALMNVTWRDHVMHPGDRALRSVRVIADEAGVSLNAKRLRAELERSAFTDPLTGSLNRRAWDIELGAILEQIRSTGGALTIGLIDLDHFKSFNDTHGHSAGDILLQEFAASARLCLRAGDVFARWGGEEFIVALPNTSPEQAVQILDRVRSALPAGSTCSVGLAIWDPHEGISACIARADLALYDAKQGGRNRLATR